MRVQRFFPGFTISGFIAAGLLSGCIITTSPSGGNGGVGGDDNSGGFGGFGGDTAGAGGQGGTGGSGGAGVSCIDEIGEGTKADCDLLNIAPGQGAGKICGPNKDEAAFGYNVCLHAYDIYTRGAADDLQQCLSKIGVEDACREPPVAVNDCVASMYKRVCDDPAIGENCDSMAETCTATESFVDRNKCIEDLRPLNNDALTNILSCFNAASQVPCEKAYTDCYDQILQF